MSPEVEAPTAAARLARIAEDLTEPQARAVRRAYRGNVDARAQTLEVLERLGMVRVRWLAANGARAELTDDGRALRSLLLHRAAPEVKAV